MIPVALKAQSTHLCVQAHLTGEGGGGRIIGRVSANGGSLKFIGKPTVGSLPNVDSGADDKTDSFLLHRSAHWVVS